MFYERIERGIPVIRSDRLAVPHGFSTRLGGVSGDAAHPYLCSLNFGENRGDAPAAVAENFRRFTAAAGLPSRVAVAKQIHSTRILSPEEAAAGELPEGDGFVTASPGVTLCVKIADCLPILLWSGEKECPGIAALHAGWRGSVAGIALQGVAALQALGARPEKICAAIGPGICSCCYEVGADFTDAFRAALGESMAKRFLLEREGRCFADLKGLNRALLLEAGLQERQIDLSPDCTCCAPDRFFSHRASHGLRGTMAAMISLGM